MTDGLASRRSAAHAYMAIMSQRKTLESALEHTRGYREMETRDRAFARAILATTFRRHGQTIAVLSKLLAKPLEETPEPAVALLVTGATQLLWMDGAPHAVVSTTVALAEENKAAFGLKGLINAVLRKVDKEGRDLAARTAPRDNLPDWMARAWRKAYGPGALARMTNVLMDPPPLDITLKDPAEREKWAEALKAEILPTGSLRRQEIGDITQLPGYRDGAWWIQDAAAAIPATLLGVKERDHVLDMCAAPGGKTLQLAALGARVTAIDSSAGRLKQLRDNLGRTQMRANVVAEDGRRFKPKGPADAILLDAPCTATGTLRRHPEASQIKKPGQVAKMVKLQLELANAATRFLRPGGTLVLCTCSLQPEEGEGLAAELLKRQSELTVRPIQDGEVPGLEDAITPEGWLRLTPAMWAEKGGLDGFFIARFEKRISA
ncbi:RsmB/NOP family class I SAM-dependent RNA methyltransferase [Maricaulis parjimensis]|uniref:RsmB/NOP family class I SAM-dependent RNA methyltransferase n=1 Tax=Maricaulis parjimensis TaxID=144023 RepID=UPI00193A3009|nr:RsmB/NOP family class I SAM-dependent RNA methyltransferase [Maricaulis parjimensis]